MHNINKDNPVIVISDTLINETIEKSRSSSRGRAMFTFHNSENDVLQRMLNAIQPGSYVQPHRHASPPKSESIVLLRGKLCFVTFTEAGDFDEHFILLPGSDKTGIDIKPGIFHTYFAIEKDTVVYEVKPGPFDKHTDKEFASWSPVEGSEEVEEYMKGWYELVE